MAIHQLVPLPRARRRQNSQTATSSTRHSLVATLNTPPPSLTSTITATRPADQLDQAAAKATPEALRCLETMWRERRKVRLAEMRAEQGIGKSPRKMRAEEDVGRIGSPVARIVQKGALGNAQTTRQTIPRYHSAKRQTNVRPTGMSKEGVSIARTGRAAGVRDFNENRGIRRRSLEQPPAMKAYELAEDTFRSKAHQRFADTLVKKVRCLPRIETTLERQRTETSNARKIKFDLLPTGRRRISKSATLAIQQEPAVSTSSILKVPTPPRRLTLSLAKETYHVHEDGREIIVEGGNDDSQRMKRIRLKDQGMWGMKDWNRWELVFGIVEKIKRHTERVSDDFEIFSSVTRTRLIEKAPSSSLGIILRDAFILCATLRLISFTTIMPRHSRPLRRPVPTNELNGTSALESRYLLLVVSCRSPSGVDGSSQEATQSRARKHSVQSGRSLFQPPTRSLGRSASFLKGNSSSDNIHSTSRKSQLLGASAKVTSCGTVMNSEL